MHKETKKLIDELVNSDSAGKALAEYYFPSKTKAKSDGKIPMHNFLEDTFGVGKIDNEEDLDRLIATLRKMGDKPIF
ncbi:hypothetical protein BK005_00010 [bacterium CG10_37_50]|nr:MAG: hypothetical protein BK005_00010 [bacterium CG10_37_50]